MYLQVLRLLSLSLSCQFLKLLVSKTTMQCCDDVLHRCCNYCNMRLWLRVDILLTKPHCVHITSISLSDGMRRNAVELHYLVDPRLLCRCCRAVRLSSPTLFGCCQPLLERPQRYSVLRRRTSCQTPSPASRLPSSSNAGHGSSGTGTGTGTTAATAATHWKVCVWLLTFTLVVPAITL